MTTQTLEETLAAICAEHDLKAFGVSYSANCGVNYKFTANCHWDGFSRDGISCCSEHASSVGAAVSNALATMRRDRSADVAEITPLPTFDEAVQ